MGYFNQMEIRGKLKGRELRPDLGVEEGEMEKKHSVGSPALRLDPLLLPLDALTDAH